MKVRKLIYSIDYVHVLTFKDHYKKMVSPYFGLPRVEYGIDNENTIDESIRMIFKNEGFVLQFKKDAATLFYEGDVADLKKPNPILEIYFTILERIQGIEEFNNIVRHRLIVNAVEITDKKLVESELNKNTIIQNPFGPLEEYSAVYEFKKGNKYYNFKYGNYNEKDITKFDLSPLKTKYNNDLFEGVGFLSETTVHEEIRTIDYSKFNRLISNVEEIINTYLKK